MFFKSWEGEYEDINNIAHEDPTIYIFFYY